LVQELEDSLAAVTEDISAGSRYRRSHDPPRPPKGYVRVFAPQSAGTSIAACWIRSPDGSTTTIDVGAYG
jgi:hypothetical protein